MNATKNRGRGHGDSTLNGSDTETWETTTAAAQMKKPYAALAVIS
ncbi:hypothetical protein CGMCC3_g6916 [Colletotrichum fructicola]|nr:uncharacterized protein CGMCC3_g6916 [Colletotrichum fructicola]KAE9577035.1 hypothetical protein CGMCC3_g6916 [Colletotrichum fructicola]